MKEEGKKAESNQKITDTCNRPIISFCSDSDGNTIICTGDSYYPIFPCTLVEPRVAKILTYF